MKKINWKQKNWKFKLGLILISSSLIFFILLIIIPLMEISNSYKITFTTISFILAEVFFYTGGFFLGKEIFNKYKAWLNPGNWFKKKSNSDSVPIEMVDNDKTIK
jgi:hypothetical protein